jgi:hypothetical protein
VSADRKSPRALLAAIVLAPAPVPQCIDIRDDGQSLFLTMATFADGLAWAAHLGAPNASTYDNPNGHTYFTDCRVPDWHGWRVTIWASRPTDAPAVELDAAEMAAVEQVAAS